MSNVGGGISVHDHDHLRNPILLERVTFTELHQSCNSNVKRQYFIPVYMHSSTYDLKFRLPLLASLHRVKVVDNAWVDGSFSQNIIPKSSEKLFLLESKWKTVGNCNTCLNKIGIC